MSHNAEDLFGLKEKVICVTGGAGVLGAELVKGFANLGAKVAILDKDMSAASLLCDTLREEENSVIAVKTDVLEKKSIIESVDEVLGLFGDIDILVNGAGGNSPLATTGTQNPFFDLPKDALQFVFDLNIMGTILPSQIMGKHFAEKGEGVILNISSMNAFRPLTKIAAYSAAKAGVSNFTQWLSVHMAREYSPKIRVNAIAPGFFLTKQNEFLLIDSKTKKMTPRGEAIINHIPAGKFGKPEQLVGTAIWLLSSAAEYVTGVVVPVDGGFSAYSGV